jgi:hypothetical protein
MKNEIIKVEVVKAEIIKAEDYGLEVKKGNEIEQSFGVNDVEINALIKVYESLVNSEITEDSIEKWNRLSIDLSHANGALNKTHKAQKSFFLNGGRFADDCKKIRANSINQMQEVSTANKKHYENLAKAKIETLQAQRELEVTPFLQEMETPSDLLGNWDESIYATYLNGAKVSHKARVDEVKRIELAKVEAEKKANDERIAKERAEALERERIRKENEQLKKEAEERERIAKIEAEKRAKEETARIAKADAERKEREEKERKAKELYEANLKAEREKRERVEREEKIKRDKLEAELKAKADAERKAKEDKEAKIQADLNKGDAAKVNDLLNDLEALKAKYIFKSAKNKAMYVSVSGLLDKLKVYINEKS